MLGILVGQEDSDHGFAVISGTDDELECPDAGLCRSAVPRYAVELSLQPIATAAVDPNGMLGQSQPWQ